MAINDPYEADFTEWTKAQAEALRAAGKMGGRSNAVEWERVAEELEDVGKSEYRAAASYLTLILEHLFKLAWTRREEPRAGWREEILRFRIGLRRRLTASIRRTLEAELATLHEDAASLAAASFEIHEPDAARDEALRWTLSEALGENGP